MKDKFEEIAKIAKFIINQSENYNEDEPRNTTEARINWIRGHANTIVGMAVDMECELEDVS